MADAIPDKRKVVILLSDGGENNAGSITPEEAVSFAKTRNIQVFTIGLGSEEPVLYDYDSFGNPLYANLDEDNLKFIAKETGGGSISDPLTQRRWKRYMQESIRQSSARRRRRISATCAICWD